MFPPKRIILLLLALLFTTNMFGGTTGKITGRITDATTGEGLPGVNIQVEGTALGASTDIDGVYVILNVPPGIYSLEISFIGYQTVRVSNVRVNVDFTTRVNQALTPTTVEGEAVNVVGERNPLVRQDLTNSQVAITSETVDALPVDQLSEVIALQAGIVEDNSGNLHIRGGRSNEVAFQVNGLSINNPFGNSQGVGIATNAIEEVSVSAGTFSAEYGNALSGVINFVTKDGGSELKGSMKAWTGDNISSRESIFYNIDDVDPLNNERMEWTLSGPVPGTGNRITFFTSGVYQNDKGHLYGMRVYKPEDLLFINGSQFLVDPFGYQFGRDASGAIKVTTNEALKGASGDREIIPMVTREAVNITGKLTVKASNNIKITYDVIFDDGTFYNSSSFRSYRFTPDGRPRTKTRNTSHSLGVTHTVSKKMFYTLKIGLNFNKARTMVYDDPFDPRYIPPPANDISQLILPQTNFFIGGTDLGRTSEKARSIIGKLDIVNQIHPKHEVKVGGEFAQHRLDLLSYSLIVDNNTNKFVIPDENFDPDNLSYQKYRRKPIQAAFYVLDKMELAEKFILNAGLRYEYLDANAPYNPNISATVDDPIGPGNPKFLKQAEPKHRVSPRLSLSFPITAEGIIRFSYGFFYQNPTFRNIYRNPRFVDANFITIPSFGNANLNPQRSIQYEMGLQQQFTEDMKVDFTIFYKDVNDLIQSRRIIAGEVAATKEYNVITNISYANVKGFTVAFVKRRSPGSPFSATLDYTYQNGEGAYDDPLALAVDTRTGRQTEQKFIPLDFDRTHTLNGTITISDPNNWSFSAIGRLQTGTPYTPSVPSNFQAVDFDVNSDRRPTITNVDLKIEKFIKFSSVRVSAFVQVENVFDQLQERFVYSSTGRSLHSLDETTNPSRFNQVRQAILANPNDFFPMHFIDNYYQREDWLGAPREVRFGLSFNF
jgi:outer membrane receptor protein involved in Fe transport